MIYVLSDIHGQKRRFDSIMKQIDLHSEDMLYILGDVIDRNPDGIRILRQLMKMPNVKIILGNHEHMMLDALHYPHVSSELGREQRMNRWYRNGGKVTHDYLKRIRKSLRTEIFEFLDKLPLNEEITVNGSRFILAHAAPVELFEQYRSFTNYESEKDFALWYRFNEFDTNPCDGTVIFGHTITHHFQQGEPLYIWHGPGLICIDCGSSTPEWDSSASTRKGRLACLRLDDMKEFYSEEVTV
jgi:serine/threonine protein phosphatase 1